MLRYILFTILGFFFLSVQIATATDVIDQINVRDIQIESTNRSNSSLEEFVSPINEFFFTAGSTGGDGMYAAFISIAFQIKNFFIGIAILFLIFGVLRLLFSPAGDDDIKNWRSNILWVTVGVFIMQISFSVWNALIIKGVNDKLGSKFGYQFWLDVLSPIVNMIQMLAAFGFIAMMMYAFYIIVTGGGDEEKLKKGKNTVMYALIGFFLIKLPEAFINAIYGTPSAGCKTGFTISNCELEKQNLTGSVQIIAKIFTFFNTFLTIICVILIVYAGWLVLISGGDEEKLKKAKNIIIYIIVGLVVLVGSHAIFRFFILG